MGHLTYNTHAYHLNSEEKKNRNKRAEDGTSNISFVTDKVQVDRHAYYL